MTNLAKLTRTAVTLLALSLWLTQSASAQLTTGNSSLLGSDRPRPLPQEQAFPYYVSIAGPDSVTVNWQPASGHYLYRHQFGFSLVRSGGTTQEPIEFSLPDGLKKWDQFFGDIEAYYDNVTATLTLDTSTVDDLTLVIQFQGCADWGFCYPPQTVEFPFNQ